MAGLCVLLEAQNNLNKSPQILSKITIPRMPSPSLPPPPLPPPQPTSSFLESCFLCRKRLSQGRDIYMYRGDRAFCSVDCRCRQIFMDEESVRRDNYCSYAASSSSSSVSAAASSSSRHRNRGTGKSRARAVAGGFVY